MSIKNIFNFVQSTTHIATSGQPEIAEFDYIAQHNYAAVINLALADSDDAIVSEGNIVSGLGMMYFHIPVSFENPQIQQLKVFIQLMKVLQNQQTSQKTNQKIWVHCAANYRVSAFMFVYKKLILNASEAEAKSEIFEFWQPDAVWSKLMQTTQKELKL